MELRDNRNIRAIRESSDSDSIGDDEIDEEHRHCEPRGGMKIPIKKRRGRPRKDNDAVNRPHPPSTADSQTKPERRGGRPPGSGTSQVLATLGGYAWNTIAAQFTPHVIIVQPGENIVDRISCFRVPCRSICIISACSSISSVVILKRNTIARTFKFEGMFEILRLFGWFDDRGREKIITITFSKPNGQVFGGVVVSLLIAATPVQVE
ncbi:AT-hook motif nuclear-localized protein 2-like isoform X1 [Cucumis melo var. makuwa]|uniref:AT-hook motif nuclear-localized protein n=1 Tax=Cucumis melo var. makuwa TaxID=1194695 RepID=A0A5A7STP4_CUCMM|nr:AT-hook motif nuclear-localized protein 2-like isoform X1 [Cucumis melo var. makuwa]